MREIVDLGYGPSISSAALITKYTDLNRGMTSDHSQSIIGKHHIYARMLMQICNKLKFIKLEHRKSHIYCV